MPHPLLDKHRATLDGAIDAIRTRSYWSPYGEMPSPRIYGKAPMPPAKQPLTRCPASASNSTSPA